MSKLVKNTLLYTLSNLLPMAVGFLLLPIYTHYLTPAAYGIISSMDVFSAILIVLFTMAVDRSVYRLYFDHKTEKDKRDFLGTITVSLYLISISVLFLLFFFRGIVAQLYKSIDFYPVYVLAIIATFFSIFSIIPKIYFQINEKAGKHVIISIIQFLLNTSFVLWFIIVKEEGAIGILKGRLVANIIILPLFIYISYRTINYTFKTQIFKESLVFSLPQIPLLLSAWILNLSDRVFIERYFNLNDVGIYSLGYKIAEIILIFVGAMHIAYSPVFFKLANSENQIFAKKKLYNYNFTYIYVLIIVTFIVCLFSKEAITILSDPKYIEASNIVPIISLAYLITLSGGLLNLSIYQEKKTMQIMFISIGTAALNIGLNFLLVPNYGIYGAALATILSFTVFFVMRYFYAKKCYFIAFQWRNILFIFVPLFLIVLLFQFLININIYLTLIIKISIVAIIAMYFLKKYYKQGKLILTENN